MQTSRHRRRQEARGREDDPHRTRLRHGRYLGAGREGEAGSYPSHQGSGRRARLRPALEPRDDVGRGQAPDGDVLLMAEWVNVGTLEEIPPGSHKVMDVNDVMIAVFNIDGQFYAIENVCTHDGGILTGGPVNGCIITCP